MDGGGTNAITDTIYLYGEEGDDQIWGSNRMDFQYIWGGEGDDIIESGRFPENSVINGNDGDDIINPANNG